MFVLPFFLLFLNAWKPEAYTPPGLDVDRLFEAFWSAKTQDRQKKAATALVRADVDFETLCQRLKKGRTYSEDVPRGLFHLTRVDGHGTTFPFSLLVPEDYVPTRKYQLRVYLHGATSCDAWPTDGSWWREHRKLGGADRILLFPAAWRDAPWWKQVQVENLNALLDQVKRTYNIDENRIYLSGLSDGGTGTYFMAFRNTTPWAGFLPLISHPAVLANPANHADGHLFVPNLTNKPFFIVNGGRDPLYPIRSVKPFVDLFQEAGTVLVFRPLEDQTHNAAWWPSEKSNMDSFMERHPRNPLPDRLFWETESTDRYTRAHWLVITELGKVPGESAIEEFNTIHLSPPSAILGAVLEKTSRNGALVLEVEPGLPAARAGLVSGDRIVEVAGMPTPTLPALAHALLLVRFGQPAEFWFERKGLRHRVQVDLPERKVSEPGVRAFPRSEQSGRVRLTRDGNSIFVMTQGVKRFTLLLSPDQFDFNIPLTVWANGMLAYEGIPEKDPEVLLNWAVVDNDRTMLFAAALDIDLGPSHRGSP